MKTTINFNKLTFKPIQLKFMNHFPLKLNIKLKLKLYFQ